MAEETQAPPKRICLEKGEDVPSRLEETFEAKYGDEPDVAAMTADFDADDSAGKRIFLQTRDEDGLTVLHYLGDTDVSNDFESGQLCQRILETDPKAAQLLDDHGSLPLKHYAYHLMDCSDDWASFKEYFAANHDNLRAEHLDGIGFLIQAFPEGIFAAGLLDELGLNRAYTFDIFDPTLAAYDENDTNDLHEEKEDANCFVGLLRFAFADAFSDNINPIQVPTSQRVAETARRALFHILCSYAYEPFFESLFQRFFTSDKASIPDVLNHGILPLHLVLRSPILPRPSRCGSGSSNSLIGGPIFGFYQMRAKGKSVALSAVNTLVQAHEEALTTQDEDGCLPLHLAVRHNLEMVQYLHMMRPDTVSVLDHQRRSPLRYACEHNCDLDVIYYLMSATPGSWLLGFCFERSKLVDQQDGGISRMIAPVVAMIPDQEIRDSLDYTAHVVSSESEPVSWSVTATWDRESTPGVTISPTTGRIEYSGCGPFQLMNVTVTAENQSGWSSACFRVQIRE